MTALADRGLAGVVAADRWVRAGATLARYAAAGVLSVVVYPVVAAVVYVALLVWATLTDQGIGGPLALPFGILLGALAGLVCTVLAAAVCALVELATVRARLARPWLVVLTWVAYDLLAVALGGVTVAPLTGPAPEVLRTVLVVLLVAAPAGVVVVVGVHSGGALTSLALRLARSRTGRTAPDPAPARATAG